MTQNASIGPVLLILAHPNPPHAIVVDVASPVAAGDAVCGVWCEVADGVWWWGQNGGSKWGHWGSKHVVEVETCG